MLRCPWCRRPVAVTYEATGMAWNVPDAPVEDVVGGRCADCGVFVVQRRPQATAAQPRGGAGSG